ncbi:hypothetical protein XENTR_v10003476 [Xenopus tropicalis]|nr:hypothetical protein XENTR_v10003476 [Xenopus tropicalis]
MIQSCHGKYEQTKRLSGCWISKASLDYYTRLGSFHYCYRRGIPVHTQWRGTMERFIGGAPLRHAALPVYCGGTNKSNAGEGVMGTHNIPPPCT